MEITEAGMRIGFLILFVSLAVAACGHDERPVVVQPPPAQTVVVPTPQSTGQQPVVVTPPSPSR
jgi:hypothetical protein